mgnify:CR=1 FL=1
MRFNALYTLLGVFNLRIMKARTLKQINKAIRKEVGNVILCKSEGCFFVSSDNIEIGLILSSLPTTSIYVCCINHQTVSEWVSDVKNIYNESKRTI